MIHVERVPTTYKVRTFINDMQTEVHIIDADGKIRFRGGFDVMPTHFAFALERLADIEPLLKLLAEPCECDVEFAGGTSMLNSITLHANVRKCERCKAIANALSKGTEP